MEHALNQDENDPFSSKQAPPRLTTEIGVRSGLWDLLLVTASSAPASSPAPLERVEVGERAEWSDGALDGRAADPGGATASIRADVFYI